MPFETANEVMIQVPWLVLTPRLPAMVGSETFAIVVSSTCMKVPSASAKAVSPRVPAGSAISGRSWLAEPAAISAKRCWSSAE